MEIKMTFTEQEIAWIAAIDKVLEAKSAVNRLAEDLQCDYMAHQIEGQPYWHLHETAQMMMAGLFDHKLGLRILDRALENGESVMWNIENHLTDILEVN